MAQELDNVRPARRKPSGGAAQGFSQRASDQIDSITNSELISRAATTFAQDAGRMAVIHDNRGIVPVGQGDDPVKLGEITILREDAVRGDHTKATTGGVF